MLPRIEAKNLKLSSAIEERLEKHYGKMRQFYDRIVDCDVILSSEKRGVSAEFIVKVPHQTLVAKAHSNDKNIFSAIDLAFERLKGQLNKYQSKLVDHHPNGTPSKEELAEPLIEPENESENENETV
jgi:putative sigma-54 modulation protein